MCCANTQIMGYLSGSSPHIKSGAVSALSLVIYNDSKICNLMPDLVPSILELLHSKAIEVIKVSFLYLYVNIEKCLTRGGDFDTLTCKWVDSSFVLLLMGQTRKV